MIFMKQKDQEVSRKFVMDTIEHLKQFYCVDKITTEIRLEDDEYYFDVLLWDVAWVRLRKGCWEIETVYGYSRYFLKNAENQNSIRDFVYDMVRALGAEDAYITDEHHGWSGVLDCSLNSFEDWVASDGENGEIREYDPSDFPLIDQWNYNYGPKYHDNFKEPKERLRVLQDRFRGYEILSTVPQCNILLGRKDGALYALNSTTGKLFVDFPIDGIDVRLNVVAVEILKGGESALYKNDGTQLTPFGEHSFNWEWAKANEVVKITDEVAQESWEFPIY